MLLRGHDGDAVIAIGQAAHAWLSGQLARAWGNERFGRVAPHEEVCLAAEQHDVGMALWDTEPTLNLDTGRPHTFMEMPLPVHLELWTAAPRRMITQSRYAALLVSLHGTALYERRDLSRLEPDAAGAVRGYLDGQRAFQCELLEQLRSDPATRESAGDALVRRNQHLLLAWDWASLALCLDWAPDALDGVPTAGTPTRIELAPAGRAGVSTLDPWPFAGERVELKTEGRLLRGRYDDEAAMRAALARAEWATLRFVLVPLGAPGAATG